MHTISNILPSHLGRLAPLQAVEAFRDLLWCQARRRAVPPTRIHITQAVNVPDGGIDVEVEDSPFTPADDPLVAGNTFFQLKTGASAAPWQESWVRKELLGNACPADTPALGPAVRRCLENHGRYVLVCFGRDPTPQQLDTARTLLAACFNQCGFPNARAEVWGQTHLVALISPYPSLCLRLMGRDQLEFQSLAEWQRDANMTPNLCLANEQHRFINEVREHLRANDVPHVRVIGEPGLGKTRLVLEALSPQEIAPLVVYVPHAEDFQKSQLFRDLLHPDSDYYSILVIDECPSKEMSSIWSALRNRSDRIRLVTIDHGPEDAADPLMRVLQCPPLPEKQIAAIISGYISSDFEACRWAPDCSGSPRVAHLVGENLRHNPDDILKPPATVPIWDRFVSGYTHTDSPATTQRLIVLRYLALFYRFGFEHPVDAEARFICELAQQADPSLTYPQFQSVVHDLQRSRILQGKTTLFIVPKLLHIHLCLQFWERHGRGFDLNAVLPRLPESLMPWFTAMFPYAHKSAVATTQVESLLAPGGLFDDEAFLQSRSGCAILNELAEASPDATMACIERTIGTWDRDRLLSFAEGRQYIVWALEKIAIWPQFFCRSAAVLLNLAENANWSNNATGTFAELFSLAYGPMGSTETPPTQRLPALRAALESDSPNRRAVGLKACASALVLDHYSKAVGPEHQGLRPTAKLWTPRIWGDLFDACKDVWNLLVQVRSAWTGEERRSAASVLIDAAFALVPIRYLATMVLKTLNGLIDDPTTDLRKLAGFVTTRLHSPTELTPATIRSIKALHRRITGRSYASRLRRHVLLGDWYEEHGDHGNPTEQYRLRIESLAAQAAARPRLLKPLIPQLITSEGNGLLPFGFALAERDPKRRVLTDLLDAHRQAAPPVNTALLSAYLAAVFRHDKQEWESIALPLLSDDALRPVAWNVVVRSGLTSAVMSKLHEEATQGRVDSQTLGTLPWNPQLQSVDPPRWNALIEAFLAGNDSPAALAALEIAHRLYADKQSQTPPPDELILKLLTDQRTLKGERNSMSDYYWQELAQRYIDNYPGRAIDVFRYVLGRCRQSQFEIALTYSSLTELLSAIIRNHPAESWAVVAGFLEATEPERAFMLQDWLAPRDSTADRSLSAPISLFPPDLLLDWISQNPELRAVFVARTVPKTFDPAAGGQLTREILIRFGHIESVGHVLWCHFRTEGIWGPASQHYREKRDEARQWLSNESEPRIRQWLEHYINALTPDIERAEIDEERRF